MSGMTFYTYLDEMQNLCLRASNAFKVIKSDNPLIADFYDAAEEGFFRKKQNCAVVDAGAPAGSVKTQRLGEFKKTVQEWENEAAYILKEQANEHGAKIL